MQSDARPADCTRTRHACVWRAAFLPLWIHWRAQPSVAWRQQHNAHQLQIPGHSSLVYRVKITPIDSPVALYMQGQYDQQADFENLNQRLEQLESRRKKADRIFYLSIPPTIFTAVAGNAAAAASSK